MNVILVVVDSLRPDHLSCYGYGRKTSPNIDSIAAKGIRFERCYSPTTWTRPAAASILTGLYPPAHGTRTKRDSLTSERELLPEKFSKAGYQTVGITAMGNVSSATGFSKGFDWFYDLYKDEQIIEKRRNSNAIQEELKNEEGIVALPRAQDIADTFGDWLEIRNEGDSFFAFCWAIDTHVPYDVPVRQQRFRDPEYNGPVDGDRQSIKQVKDAEDIKQLQSIYDEAIHYTDKYIGYILRHLEEAGCRDETLVCILGDHGESFFEHGRFGHGHIPHEEVVRVPCILDAPGSATTNKSSELISLVDIYPTLLDAAGIENAEPPSIIGGRSVSDVIYGEHVDGHPRVYFETETYDMQNKFIGVRTEKWKYIEVEEWDKDIKSIAKLIKYILEKGILTDVFTNSRYYWRRYRYDERIKLYDLESDPDEMTNQASQLKEVQNQLSMLIESWLDKCREFRKEGKMESNVAIDDQTHRQLRHLGYDE